MPVNSASVVSGPLRLAGNNDGLPGRDGVWVRDEVVQVYDLLNTGVQVLRDVVEGVALDDPVPAQAGVGLVSFAVALGGGHAGEGGEGDEDRGGPHCEGD